MQAKQTARQLQAFPPAQDLLEGPQAGSRKRTFVGGLGQLGLAELLDPTMQWPSHPCLLGLLVELTNTHQPPEHSCTVP